MKVRAFRANNRKRVFELTTARGVLPYPYSKCDPEPTKSDPIVKVIIDDEIAREGITYWLKSGAEGCVLVDMALDYNHDPRYVRDATLYKLTAEACDRMAASSLSRREVARRLGTSPTQLYRLLDTTYYGKTIDKMLMLLQVLDCDVEFVVRARGA